MANGWNRVQGKSESIRGIAVVKADPKGLKFKLSKVDDTRYNDVVAKVYGIENDKEGKNIPAHYLKDGQFRYNGLFRITVTTDCKRLWNITPASGVYKCRFMGFVAAQGQLPTPAHYKSPAGFEFSSEYDYFTALYEIAEGEFEGLSIPHRLRYYFAKGPDGKAAISKGEKSKYANELVAWLDVHGLTEPVDWEENLLPTLQAIIANKGRTVQIVLKDGYVDSLVADGYHFSDAGLEDEDFGEETPAEDNGLMNI